MLDNVKHKQYNYVYLKTKCKLQINKLIHPFCSLVDCIGHLHAPYQHYVNILLHCIVSTLIYGVLKSLLKVVSKPYESATLDGRRVAFIASILFAVHPVHTECVCFETFKRHNIIYLFPTFRLQISPDVLSYCVACFTYFQYGHI
jgi:hypothetical protein